MVARPFLAEWASYAFAHWREDAPALFPETASWKEADQWASPNEATARRNLREFEAAEAARLLSATQERSALSERARAQTTSGTQWRALLSETGEALVLSVSEALSYLGFTVVDADTLPNHKGRKREDLRVSHGSWVALVEVKGYAGAAKSNDLMQLTAASTAFATSENVAPDALWYIVNIHREIDPTQRPQALPGRDDDLDSFAENHRGSLIDTRDLFRLRQEVVDGV